jgi:hypothetical protein
MTLIIHLVENRLATKNEQIRILGDDSINCTPSFEIRQLGICFIRCYDILDSGKSESLCNWIVSKAA